MSFFVILLQIKLNVLEYAMPEIKNLYQWLEVDFNPLEMCKDVESVTNILSENEELSTYVKPLQDITIVKLLNQVIAKGKTRSVWQKKVVIRYSRRIDGNPVSKLCAGFASVSDYLDSQVAGVSFVYGCFQFGEGCC